MCFLLKVQFRAQWAMIVFSESLANFGYSLWPFKVQYKCFTSGERLAVEEQLKEEPWTVSIFNVILIPSVIPLCNCATDQMLYLKAALLLDIIRCYIVWIQELQPLLLCQIQFMPMYVCICASSESPLS